MCYITTHFILHTVTHFVTTHFCYILCIFYLDGLMIYLRPFTANPNYVIGTEMFSILIQQLDK